LQERQSLWAHRLTLFLSAMFGIIQRFASNQALERTAARRAFTLLLMKTVLPQAELALSGGRSACSR
jgi:hypothetical protein